MCYRFFEQAYRYPYKLNRPRDLPAICVSPTRPSFPLTASD